MAVQERVPIEEYLGRSYDGPEPDYVDGEIVERAMVEYPHSRVAIQLAKLFAADEFEGRLYPAVELRVRTSDTRIRIIDFSVFEDEPTARVPTTPPLLAVEILSRDDRFLDLALKLEEYEQWGVKHVWMVDPWTRQFSHFQHGRLQPAEQFTIPEYELTIGPADLFPPKAS